MDNLKFEDVRKCTMPPRTAIKITYPQLRNERYGIFLAKFMIRDNHPPTDDSFLYTAIIGCEIMDLNHYEFVVI